MLSASIFTEVLYKSAQNSEVIVLGLTFITPFMLALLLKKFESGILIDATLVYLPYNIAESMRLTFDENNGFVTGFLSF